MNIYHRLDDVQMSALDRERAKANMRNAELTIDFVAAVVTTVRSISAALGRRVVDLARRIQLPKRQAAQQ